MTRSPVHHARTLAALAAGALCCAQGAPSHASSAGGTRGAGTPVVAAYLPDYRLASFRPEQAAGLTDLILFSVRPEPDGHVRDPGGLLRWLEAEAPHRGLHRYRTLLAVGGGAHHRSDAFPTVAADPKLRRRFVDELVGLATRHGLDGLDVDWEPIDGPEARALLAGLLVELRRALGARPVLLSVSVAEPSALLPEAVAAVDRVQLMAYDGPAHGSLRLATRRVEAALAQGIPAGKLTLGIPLYALGPHTALSWRELVARYHPEPARDAVDDLRFNGVETARAKARLVREARLGGVFFWELTQDAAGEAALIGLVRQALAEPAR